MKTAVVRMSDILAEPGQPLNASYWCGRQGSESYAAWKARTEVERLEQDIAALQERIERLRGHQERLGTLDSLAEVTSYIRKIRHQSKDQG